MCGIVGYFGQYLGIIRVLEALYLLEYRAPDSAGLAGLAGANGDLVVRRCVGPPRRLVAAMAANPLYKLERYGRQPAIDLLAKQDLGYSLDELRDCSPHAGFSVFDLYNSSGLMIGLGDRGALDAGESLEEPDSLSARMRATVQACDAAGSPDYDQDPVRHAMQMVATHVASQLDYDDSLRRSLDIYLLQQLPTGMYTGWLDAWHDEVIANVPGRAFTVAVRHFQETFPGLADNLSTEEMGRVGGLTAVSMAQVIPGHGRWAMVGAVTEENAHPIYDRSRTRVVCENGSHNASLMLGIRAEQEDWWRARGVAENEPVHRTENTTEVIVYEWERACHQIQNHLDGGHVHGLSGDELEFLADLERRGVAGLEERGIRLALWRVRPGNAHACAFFGRREPGVLYISSHSKPIAIATRRIEQEGAPCRQELMIASDVNAALMLWPGDEVDAATRRIHMLEAIINQHDNREQEAVQEIEALLDHFRVDVIFLDANLYQGNELLVRISNCIQDGKIVPDVRLTRYDGTSILAEPQQVCLNPAMVGRGDQATYTEHHITEIPDVVDGIVRAYVNQGQVQLDSVWHEGQLVSPGLNINSLSGQYGQRLERLNQIWLIGEGSSWRDAQAGALLFRQLIPDVVVNVYRPVEVLNLGHLMDPAGDLAVEISWSGTTDSLLKVDTLLAEEGVVRIGVTGRPQSDLGRRAAISGGTLDVRSGVEVSVATVKGFESILVVLNLLALQLAAMRDEPGKSEILSQLTDDLALIVPQHVRAVIEDIDRRARMRHVTERCRDFNKVAVIGTSPIDVEGELKIEELAQIVANCFEFNSASMRSLIERSAIVDDDRQRTLFVINATTPERQLEAEKVIDYLSALGVFNIVHTTHHPEVAEWESIPTTEVFVSPNVSDLLQPLVDAPFFFDLAVALAYARGLSSEDIDRPRNLAKSVTTTGAERRVDIEARREFHNVSLAEFGDGALAKAAWDPTRAKPSRAALRATVALRASMASMSRPLPRELNLDGDERLIVVTDTEATENAASMAAVAWQKLLGITLTVYRRFVSELPEISSGTNMLRIVRAGAVLSVRDGPTIALPADMSPLQLEMLGSVYMISLAVRLARQRGMDTSVWESGLAQMPLLVTNVFNDDNLAKEVVCALSPLVRCGYDKIQIIGGGQDHASARSIARSLRMQGFMAEALYTDSAWHGPLATVGGPDAEHDTLIFILATDPLFQAAALVDTQVYRTRNAPVLLVVPDGNRNLQAVRGVNPTAVLAVPAVPRPFVPILNVAVGDILAREMAQIWEEEVFR